MVGVSQLSSSLPMFRMRFARGRLLPAFVVRVGEALQVFGSRMCLVRRGGACPR